MAKAPSTRPRVDTAKCPQCAGVAYRIPRLASHKLLLGSKRFRCDECNLICLKWMGMTLDGATKGGAKRMPPASKPSPGVDSPSAAALVAAKAESVVKLDRVAAGSPPAAFPFEIPELVYKPFPGVPAEVAPAGSLESKPAVVPDAIPAVASEATTDATSEPSANVVQRSLPFPAPITETMPHAIGAESTAINVPAATTEDPALIPAPISTPDVEVKKPPIKKPAIAWPVIKRPTIRLPKIELPKFQLPKIKLPQIIIPKFKWPKTRWPNIQWPSFSMRWPDFTQIKVRTNWAGMIRINVASLSPEARERAKTLRMYVATGVGVLAVIAALYLLWFVLLPHLLSGDRSIRFS